MPLLDSKTGKIRKEYSIDELKERANYMRGLDMISLCSAKSGHSGGTLSMFDVLSALYLVRGHPVLAGIGAGALPEPGGLGGHGLHRDHDASEFQSPHPPGRLLPAE